VKIKSDITFKFNIENNINITEWLRPFNSVVRSAYNRFIENPELPSNEIIKLLKSLKNIENLDYSMIKNAVCEASALVNRKSVIFGSKKLFNDIKFHHLKKNPKYTLDECKQRFKDKRLNRSLMLVGCASEHGNRKAELDIIENNSIILKFDKKNHIVVKLSKLSKKRKRILCNLENLCKEKKACFTVKVNNKNINIIIDQEYAKDLYNKVSCSYIKNRILSIDLNPNYIGLSICDWHTKDKNTIIYKEIIDITKLNKLKEIKFRKNKRSYETSIINKHIIDLAYQYRCELVVFEHLDIDSKDHSRGKTYNYLVNNCWNRTKLLQNLIKHCNIFGIRYKQIRAMYTSFIGQMMYEDEYDSIAASIEISRRANLMNRGQYKNIIYPRFDVSCIPTLWKKMVQSQDIIDWKNFYNLVKKSKIRYRFLFALKEFQGISLSLKSCKSLVVIRRFI
jgi:phosphopantetheine adenylyltransferase